MTEASEKPAYRFDVAVSYAGEDRELVEEIVTHLKEEGVRVFYDTDYQPEMWGENLAEYLDRIYRVEARYAIIFVSRAYAEKMWPRHERRSALARALSQAGTYLLPVRLDDTALEGLNPVVSYLDAQQIGADGIVRATLAKLAAATPTQSSAIMGVPRTAAGRREVLRQRPPAWEFLYFASLLLFERDSVESKYRDHEIHYASPTEKSSVATISLTTFADAPTMQADLLRG